MPLALHLKAGKLAVQLPGRVSCSHARRHKQLVATVLGAPNCVSLPADSEIVLSPVAHTVGHLPHANSCHGTGSSQLLSATCQKVDLFLVPVMVISKVVTVKSVMGPHRSAT